MQIMKNFLKENILGEKKYYIAIEFHNNEVVNLINAVSINLSNFLNIQLKNQNPHITLFMSENYVKLTECDFKQIQGMLPISIKAEIHGIEILNTDDGTYFLLILKSPKVEELRNKIYKEYKFKHKFSPWLPHVTIAYLKSDIKISNENRNQRTLFAI